ncbi:hypothetical protein [Hwanghaeella sp.]|uniref:hypothetical protein n=1 Tax=Hwanghaeella sp. TaxID=2605943 RepID=UPI003CCB7D14
MRTYSFTITAAPVTSDRDSDAIVDALFEAGCDDATVVERAGVFVIAFDREAGSLPAALRSAQRDVARAGLKPCRFGPDPLVSAADIAERGKLSRQRVSNYVMGKRGKDFPLPVARQETDSPLWAWPEVSAWLVETGAGSITEADVKEARTIEKENLALAG